MRASIMLGHLAALPVSYFIPSCYSIPAAIPSHCAPLEVQRMRCNPVATRYRHEAACTTCRARLSHPITDDPVVSVVSLFHSIPFHSISVSFHPVHSCDLSSVWSDG